MIGNRIVESWCILGSIDGNQNVSRSAIKTGHRQGLEETFRGVERLDRSLTVSGNITPVSGCIDRQIPVATVDHARLKAGLTNVRVGNCQGPRGNDIPPHDAHIFGQDSRVYAAKHGRVIDVDHRQGKGIGNGTTTIVGDDLDIDGTYIQVSRDSRKSPRRIIEVQPGR